MHSYLEGQASYDLPSTPQIRHKLDIVETLFPQSPLVIAAATRAVVDLHRYPAADDLDELTTLVRDYMGIGSDEFTPLFTNGSDNALKLIIDTFFTRESRVVIVTPTYPHFIQMAKCSAATICEVECHTEADIIARIDQFSNAKIIYLCTPNLPLGYEAATAVRHLLERTEAIVIADEAYTEYGASSVRDLIGHPRLIVVRTFSKFFGLAALRLGYLITTRTLRDQLRILHNGKNITRVAVAAAVAALRDPDHFIGNLAEFRLSQAYLLGALPRVMGREITQFNIKSGNFFLIYARDPAAVVRQFAQFASIAVRDKSGELPGAIRISIAGVDLMRVVIRVIRFINGFPGVDWLVDLDGTLRPDSKLTSRPTPGAQEFLKTNKCTVVTNNTVHTASEICDQLGVELPVIQPQAPAGYFVIARGALNTSSTYLGVAIMNSVLDVGSDAWALAAEIADRGLPVVAVELPRVTRASDASECRAAMGRIPDVGSMIAALGVTCGIIGKPNIQVPQGPLTHVIGDSSADRALAEKNGLEFVLVNPDVDQVQIAEETVIPDLSYINNCRPAA